MNKPAPKEPSMDEILSSIRQIIADDDAANVPRRPSIQAAPPPMEAAPASRAGEPDAGQAGSGANFEDVLDEIEPLALSPSQIVDENDDEGDSTEGLSFDSILADTESQDSPALVDPDDIAFEPDAAEAEAAAFVADIEDDPVGEVRMEPEPVREPAPQPEPPRAAATQSVPMPDPTLSRDMADQLLEPATNAAVRATFSKLGNLGLGNHGITIEAMIRDMLRPMLKEWLDENLPSVVERMVEKEIMRISRGE